MILSPLFKFTFIACMLKVNKSGLYKLPQRLALFLLGLGTFIYSHFSLASYCSLTYLLIPSPAIEPTPAEVEVTCYTEEVRQGIDLRRQIIQTSFLLGFGMYHVAFGGEGSRLRSPPASEWRDFRVGSQV